MIAFETLLRLACGDLEGAEEDAAEEHILACTDCARTLEGLVVVGEAVRELLGRAEHPLHLFATPALMSPIEDTGLVTRRYTLAPGEVVPCSIADHDLYVLTTFTGDLGDAMRVDVETAGQRVADVPFDASRGRITLLSPAGELRKLPTTRLPVRVFAFDAAGGERLVGTYTLDHTAQTPS